VLSRAPAGQERQILDSIARACDVLPRVLDGDLGQAMKELHTQPAPESDDNGNTNNGI
jgi:hypothetical protein